MDFTPAHKRRAAKFNLYTIAKEKNKYDRNRYVFIHRLTVEGIVLQIEAYSRREEARQIKVVRVRTRCNHQYLIRTKYGERPIRDRFRFRFECRDCEILYYQRSNQLIVKHDH